MILYRILDCQGQVKEQTPDAARPEQLLQAWLTQNGHLARWSRRVSHTCSGAQSSRTASLEVMPDQQYQQHTVSTSWALCSSLQTFVTYALFADCTCTQPHGNSTKGKGALAYFATFFHLFLVTSGAGAVYNQQQNWADFKVHCIDQEDSVNYGWLLRNCTVDFSRAVQN